MKAEAALLEAASAAGWEQDAAAVDGWPEAWERLWLADTAALGLGLGGTGGACRGVDRAAFGRIYEVPVPGNEARINGGEFEEEEEEDGVASHYSRVIGGARCGRVGVRLAGHREASERCKRAKAWVRGHSPRLAPAAEAQAHALVEGVLLGRWQHAVACLEAREAPLTPAPLCAT